MKKAQEVTHGSEKWGYGKVDEEKLKKLKNKSDEWLVWPTNRNV